MCEEIIEINKYRSERDYHYLGKYLFPEYLSIFGTQALEEVEKRGREAR
jgi:hypothetical protein